MKMYEHLIAKQNTLTDEKKKIMLKLEENNIQ